MKTGRYFIILLVSMWLPAACTYSDSGYFMVEPEPDDTATCTVTTNLDTMIEPTLTVTDTLWVVFEAEVNNGELYRAICILEDSIMYDSITASEADTLYESFILLDSFGIPPSISLDPGLYPLYMDFLYSSNTNSLGDIYGYEWETKELEYAIRVQGDGQ